jgi:hypothetical protein
MKMPAETEFRQTPAAANGRSGSSHSSTVVVAPSKKVADAIEGGTLVVRIRGIDGDWRFGPSNAIAGL